MSETISTEPRDELGSIDEFVDPAIRSAIERTYYARINRRCALAEVLKDPSFVADPSRHVALFADHGVVHARDVAAQILRVLDVVNGVLIPRRDADRLQWMKAYGVLVALVHDIGMVDLSKFGRSMHPEYATQAVMRRIDQLMDRLWTSDRGQFATRIARLIETGTFAAQASTAVAREMLAMANCHSKSKVPVALLNDPAGLRRAMRIAAGTELRSLHAMQRGQVGSGVEPSGLASEPDSFAWLESKDGAARELVEDVIDTLRALRCADALRQRGTTLKTSGSYEVFVDQRSANAIYALRPDARHLYLLEVPDPIAAGEANLAASTLDPDGNLRLAFHRGAFRNAATVQRAAQSAALVVADIQADVIGSFERPRGTHGLRAFGDVGILIESVDDNPDFASFVGQELGRVDPAAARRLRIVPPPAAVPVLERGCYGEGVGLDWTCRRKSEFLARVAETGHRTDRIDPVAAFGEVRCITLKSGERLIEAGAPSNFVYIPLSEGLVGRPVGGYEEFRVHAWTPVGVTGVIRGATRNAEVRAERVMALLAIPKDAFLDHWHFTYDLPAFAALVAKTQGTSAARA